MKIKISVKRYIWEIGNRSHRLKKKTNKGVPSKILKVVSKRS